MSVRLTGAVIDFFDRTRPLIDGHVTRPDVDFKCIALPPRVLDERFVEFDVAEVALGTYVVLKSNADEQFTALPVFPYRSFFFSNVFVNVSSGIEQPADLEGKRVGTGGLHLSGTVWMRGLLEELYGVDSASFHWYTRASEPGSVRERLVKAARTPDTRLEIVQPEDSISDMLESGELDAWIGPSPPECFTRGTTQVRRLLQNYRSVEEDYARRTGVFPMIHVIVLRQNVSQQHPWLSQCLVDMFVEARQLGLAALENGGVFACGLPWLRHDLEELPKIFGGDPYAYGLEPNRRALSAFLKHAGNQGVSNENLEVDDLFPMEIDA